jgi:hypothetical protein
MRRSRHAEEIDRQAIGLHRDRVICALLRKEGLLSHNSRLVLRLADRLLQSYSYRTSNRI